MTSSICTYRFEIHTKQQASKHNCYAIRFKIAPVELLVWQSESLRLVIEYLNKDGQNSNMLDYHKCDKPCGDLVCLSHCY